MDTYSPPKDSVYRPEIYDEGLFSAVPRELISIIRETSKTKPIREGTLTKEEVRELIQNYGKNNTFAVFVEKDGNSNISVYSNAEDDRTNNFEVSVKETQ